MKFPTLAFSLVLLLLQACNKEEIPAIVENPPFENEKFFYEDGDRWLWGGHEDNMHFKINNLTLRPENFKYGLGRENFGVLDEAAQYTSVTEASTIYKEGDEVIMVHANEGSKAYPIDLMVKHEVVNEVIDEHPVVVGYCVLADFVGVHSRNYCGKTLTFAVSGYTYWDQYTWFGRDGFILWDRDTESLWWPISGFAVSGDMEGNTYIDTPGNITWERVDWTTLVQDYPDAQVLAQGQNPDPVENFPRLDPADLNCP